MFHGHCFGPSGVDLCISARLWAIFLKVFRWISVAMSLSPCVFSNHIMSFYAANASNSLDFISVSALNETDMSQEEIQCCFQKGTKTWMSRCTDFLHFDRTSYISRTVESKGARNVACAAQLRIYADHTSFNPAYELFNITGLRSFTPALSLPSVQGMFVCEHLIWQQDNQSSWPLDCTSQELKLLKRRFPAKAKAEVGHERIHRRISLQPKSLPVKHHLWGQPQSQLWLE